MLEQGEAWDTVEKAIKNRQANGAPYAYLVLPKYQNELACRIWQLLMPQVRERFYDAKCDFPARINTLPKLSTITRVVRDSEFESDKSHLAMIEKQILQDFPYLVPPRKGHDEEWLYQNEFVIRVWEASWRTFDIWRKTFKVDGVVHDWTPAGYGNVFEEFLKEKMAHHNMKHVMLKVMTIERDRRHIQDTGIYTEEIVRASLGMPTIAHFQSK